MFLPITRSTLDHGQNFTHLYAIRYHIHQQFQITIAKRVTFYSTKFMSPILFNLNSSRDLRVLCGFCQEIRFFHRRWVGFCTLCFYFPTIMLHLNATFFSTKMLGFLPQSYYNAQLMLIHRSL